MSRGSLSKIDNGQLFFNYLRNKTKLQMMKEAVKKAEEELEPLENEVRSVLQNRYADKKWRAEFSLDAFSTEEQKFIGEDCTGLRLARRSRKENLGDERLEKALVVSCNKRLRARIPDVTDEQITVFAGEVAKDVNESKATKTSFLVVPIRKVAKDGRKRKHAIQEDDDEEEQKREQPIRLSQRERPTFSLSQQNRHA